MSEVKKVITVADRSTKALVTATAGLAKVAAELAALSENSVSLSQEIEFRQSELDNVNAQFDTRLREANAELKLKVIEDEDKVLATLLKARGLVTIVPADLSALQSKLAHAERDLETELAEATAAGKTSAAIAFNAEKASLVAEHRVTLAQHEANARSAADRITFLTEQNTSLKDQITAERETRLEIAKAESQRAGVTVNNAK